MTKANPHIPAEAWMTAPDRRLVKDLKKSMAKFDEENIKSGVEKTAEFKSWQEEQRRDPQSKGYVRVIQ